MAKEHIITFLNNLTAFTEPELEIILKHFEEKTIKRKTILLRAGEISTEVYFIINGCIRNFYEKDGQDISAYFFTENMFAGAYESFTTHTPSRHSIEAIEDCNVLILSYKDMQELYVELPKMNEFIRKVVESRFVALHALFTSQILDSPEERYLNLIKHQPDLLKRVPQHQIATFLGVTPVSLSRIRNRVTKK